MNSIIQYRTTILLIGIACVLACSALGTTAQAVVPLPDGCYPNFTTAEGCDALSLLTTGAGNTALGGVTSSGGTAVFINSSEQLGTVTSSSRFKKDIKPMNKVSEVLFALNPVTFCYKKELDPKGAPQFGLIAEEVAKVDPDLVVLDDQGKPFTVRYEEVNAMLLNEFLKEHRKVEQLEKQVAALTVGLQKVSAQLELSKAAPQTVLNSR
jgi:hypothetical protein